VGIALLVRHHHASAAKAEQALTGCTASMMNQLTLRNDKDNQTYTLLTGDLALEPGERVEVKGVPVKDGSRQNAFHVRSLVGDYGGCDGTAAAARTNRAAKKAEVEQEAK
jgi:hypothetical protein